MRLRGAFPPHPWLHWTALMPNCVLPALPCKAVLKICRTQMLRTLKQALPRYNLAQSMGRMGSALMNLSQSQKDVICVHKGQCRTRWMHALISDWTEHVC